MHHGDDSIESIIIKEKFCKTGDTFWCGDIEALIVYIVCIIYKGDALLGGGQLHTSNTVS